jgi:hypothetical protein
MHVFSGKRGGGESRTHSHPNFRRNRGRGMARAEDVAGSEAGYSRCDVLIEICSSFEDTRPLFCSKHMKGPSPFLVFPPSWDQADAENKEK